MEFFFTFIFVQNQLTLTHMRLNACLLLLLIFCAPLNLPAISLHLFPAEVEKQDCVDSIQILDAARLLSAYVQIPSVTGSEKPAGEFLADECRKRKLHVRILTDEPDSYNFVASLYPLEESRPNIILLNHIDVVPPGNPDTWAHPPFSGAMVDGYVWGRGAIDNKAMGIMQMLALQHFVESAAQDSLPYNVSMLSVSGEETGGEKGAAIVVSDYLELLNPVVAYGEGGTGLSGVAEARPEQVFFGISIAQKRGIWLELISTNVSSGHGSVPRRNYPTKDIVNLSAHLLNERQRLTLSPPVKMMFHELGRHETGLRKLVLRNIGFFRPLVGNTLRQDPLMNALLTNTVTLTNIRGLEGAYNQISAEVRATFDVRLLPMTDAQAFLDNIRQRASQYDIHMEVLSIAPSGEMSEIGAYYHAMKDAIISVYPDAAVAPMMFPAHNDNIFFRMHGIPAYGVLPALLSEEMVESIHAANERMSKLELYRGVMVYKELIGLLMRD